MKEKILGRVWQCAVASFLIVVSPAHGGEADVLDAQAFCNDTRVCRFMVTVAHADEGWEHYANKWEILSPDGEVLGTRELLHPHTDEQPFTRTLTRVQIPAGVSEVIIRAHDSVHGYGGQELRIEIPKD